LQPAGYHVTNILLHGLGAVLFWRVLVRLGVPAAWFAAALFALHPVEVESVAWITERKNVLSGLLYWASLLAYLRFSPPEEGAGPRRAALGWYFVSLLLFVGALLSKTITCSLPAVLVLLLWWKRGRVGPGDLWALAPFFLLGVSLGLFTAWWEKYHVGASGSEWEMSWPDRFVLAGRALCFYVGKLVLPLGLTFIYPRWRIDWRIGWQLLFPLAALVLAPAGLWALRRRAGRGPLVAYLCFAGTLFPALGFLNVFPFRYSFVADHFQYLASAALLAGFAAFAGYAGIRYGIAMPWQRLAAAAVLVTLGILTWGQCHVYQDLVTLWTATLRNNPTCWMAYNNLGHLLLTSGRVEEARTCCQRSLALNPGNKEARYNLGTALLYLGHLDEAEEQFLLAIRTEPADARPYCNLGLVCERQGNDAEAERLYRHALELNPDFWEAHNNLGRALGRKGHPAEAVPQFRAAVAGNPDSAEARFNLSRALWQTGARSEAITVGREALQLAEVNGNGELASAIRRGLSQLEER
jgi:Flp pilus assembly protein TadD